MRVIRGTVASVALVALGGALAGLPHSASVIALHGRAADLALAADVSHDAAYAGLAPDPRCGESLVVDATGSDGLPACTHGPDPAPPGVDDAAGSTSPTPAPAGPGIVGCYDDGTSGYRVQAIYAHADDVTDRYASVVDALRTYAAAADGAFEQSAQETGGDRHVRFVTEPSPSGAACQLSVLDVTLPATADDTFSNTITALQAQSFTRADRRYLVWMDATVYCGIAQLRSDDSSAQTNVNNGRYPGYARVDAGCWGNRAPVEAHELLHTFGGVQTTAPHATPAFHCYDEWDLMCYADGSGVPMQTICASSSHDALLDCNHDDYFSTDPAAGSYLATHWNSADSRFLTALAPTNAPTTTTSEPTSSSTTSTAPEPTTTTSSPAPTTSTVTSPPPTSPPPTSPPPAATPPPAPSPNLLAFVTGAFPRRSGSRTYAVRSGGGTFSVAGGSTSPLTIVIRNARGKIVGRARGTHYGVTLHLPPGAYRISVAGRRASYAFTVDYPRP